MITCVMGAGCLGINYKRDASFSDRCFGRVIVDLELDVLLVSCCFFFENATRRLNFGDGGVLMGFFLLNLSI